MRIVYAYADHPGEGNCSNWLCAFPATALSRAGHDARMIHISEFVADPPSADIVVVERVLWNGYELGAVLPGPSKDNLSYWAGMRCLDAIEDCQQLGSKVIAIFDDHYDAFPEDIPGTGDVASKWLHGIIDRYETGAVPIDEFKEGLGIVDAVMVPSEFLADYYGQYVRSGKMFRIHNRPDLSLFDVMGNAYIYEKLAVGWSGTANHLASWRGSPVLDALETLRDHVMVVGIFSKEIEGLITDRGIDCVRMKNVNIDKFPRVVASYDIGICPLVGEFDRGRSWIKWLECSLMGKPVVAQNHSGVYDECYGGFIVDTADQWAKSIALLSNNDAYTKLSQMGRAWAWQQGWDENLKELTDIFEEVLGDN